MRNSIVKGITAIFVAGVLAAGVCCTGFASRGDDGKWFGNGNISTWHWKDKTDDKAPDDKPDDNKPDDKPNGDETGSTGGGFLIGESDNEQLQFLSAKIPLSAYAANGISEQADAAYRITVSFTGDVAYAELSYTLAYANAQSEFAQSVPVTDCVRVDVSDEDNKQANLVCLRPFGEQIILTITATDFNLSTTVTLDYARKVTGGSYTFTGACGVEQSFEFKEGLQYLTAATGLFGTSYAQHAYAGAEPADNYIPISGVRIKYDYSDVYTVEDTFEYKLVRSFGNALQNYILPAAANWTGDNRLHGMIASWFSERSYEISEDEPYDFSSLASLFCGSGSDLFYGNAYLHATINGYTYPESLVSFFAACASRSDLKQYYDTSAVHVINVTATGTYSSFSCKVELAYSADAFGGILTGIATDKNEIIM